MASKGSNTSQKRRDSGKQLSQPTSTSKSISGGDKRKGGNNTGKKKARGRSKEPLLLEDQVSDKELGTEHAILTTYDSNPISLQLVKDQGKTSKVSEPLDASNCTSTRPLSAISTSTDEGIGISPRSSTGIIEAGEVAESGVGGRSRNSHSKSSSISSSDCYKILEDEEHEMEGFHGSLDKCHSDTVNIVQQKNILEDMPVIPVLEETDSYLDLTLTPTIPRSNTAGAEKLQTSPKMFHASHSNASTGDTCPFTPMKPHQVTSEGELEYAETPNRLLVQEEGHAKPTLATFNMIMREATVAIVRDNFDRVTQEHDRILEHYETTIVTLKNERMKLKKQFETEKKNLSKEILREREQKEMESAKTSDLIAEVGTLRANTREFQRTKDEVEELKITLREKEEELQKLRKNMQDQSEKLSPFLPQVQADAEQIEQMDDSEMRLQFLFLIQPDKKTIEDEIHRQKNRSPKRPYTV